MAAALQESFERIIGRYAIYDQIAAGGMAVVHFGRLLGQAGFSRTVAIKRLHPQFASDPEFVAMFLDEAHLAVRVQHPNVVAPLDVVVSDDELLVVMDYVSGETLAQLLRESTNEATAPPIVVSVLVDTLYGLHAAHDALGEDGTPLNIVHRDVSPQNIIVGVDGIARVLDFGVAKAAMRSHATKEGEIKGKIAYMAPEQLKAQAVDRRTDVFAAGIVLWEALAGRRLFRGDDLAQTIHKVLHTEIPLPSSLNAAVNHSLDDVVMRALERDPARRFPTAREFAVALEGTGAAASPSRIAEWVKTLGGARLAQRMERVAAIESRSSTRMKVAARSPLHTPLGLEAASGTHLLNAGSAGPAPQWGHSNDEAPTVRPGPPTPETEAEREPTLGNQPTGGASKRVMVTVAAVALLSGMLLSWWGRATPPAAAVNTGRLSEPRNNAPRPAPVAAVAAAVVGQQAPTNDPTAEPSVTAVPASTALKPRKVSGRRQAVASMPSKGVPARATANCSPPFLVDAQGIRRIKPECH